MAAQTRHLITGILLSLTIVVGASTALRLVKLQAVEAAATSFTVACIQ